MESASIKFQRRVQRFPARGSPEKMSYLEQEEEEGGRLLQLSYSCHSPKRQKIKLIIPNQCSREANDKCVRMCHRAPVC